MSDADAKRRARARLSLRAERAMGMNAVTGVKGMVAVANTQAKRRPVGTNEARSTVRDALYSPPIAVSKTALTSPVHAEAQSVKAVAPTLLPIFDGEATFTAEVLSTSGKKAALDAMDRDEVKGCPKCKLAQTRTHTVFGEGDPDANLMFIGEGPGENEDLTGRPFIGRAGDKLTQMIQSMGLTRETVFIANIVKCRPPGNRDPMDDEIAACTPYLVRQIEIIRPRVIVTLGRPATQYLLKTKIPISKLRGNWQSWRGIELMPTFHPAYLLRNYTPETRAQVWADLQLVMDKLGLKKSSAGGAR